MTATKRKDSKGRNLKSGEVQMPDGRYKFQWRDESGNRKTVYSWKLVPTDRIPVGKREDLSLREKEDEIQQDQHDGINSKAARSITLNDMFESYMKGNVMLKQSTRTNYTYLYKKYVSEVLGSRSLQSIKYSDIKLFYTSLVTEKGFKPNSMKLIHAILHPVFSQAVRDEYIRKNPTEEAMNDVKKSHNWEKSKRHALSIDEQHLFISFVAGSDLYRHWLPIFTCFLGTGCRAGELLGLRWEDCDFEKGLISINHSLTYKLQDNGKMEVHISTPKTLSGCRSIPMLSEVRSALVNEKLRQAREGGSTQVIDGYSGFVFTNREGHIHIPNVLNMTILRILKACNEEEAENAKKENREPIEVRRFSLHNLRHTFCTRFCENETNIKVIQEIMGHADISTTMNVYAEATEEKKRESIRSLEGKIKIS